MSAATIQGKTIPPRRQPYFGSTRKSKGGRHHADDRIITPAIGIERQNLSEDIRITAEASLPQVIPDYCNAIPFSLILLRQERATAQLLHSERLHETDRNVTAPNLLAAF